MLINRRATEEGAVDDGTQSTTLMTLRHQPSIYIYPVFPCHLFVSDALFLLLFIIKTNL